MTENLNRRIPLSDSDRPATPAPKPLDQGCLIALLAIGCTILPVVILAVLAWAVGK